MDFPKSWKADSKINNKRVKYLIWKPENVVERRIQQQFKALTENRILNLHTKIVSTMKKSMHEIFTGEVEMTN